MKLGYWPIYARAAPIRYMLWYGDKKYTEKIYESFDEWGADKAKMIEKKILLANLPYLETDCGKTIAETAAIVKFLARKFKLIGKTEEELILQDQLDSYFEDLMKGVYKFLFKPEEEFEKEKKQFAESIPAKLKVLERILKEKQFLLGNSVSFVDFQLLFTAEVFKKMNPSAFVDVENVSKWMNCLLDLPKIKAFKATKEGQLPFFPPKSWGLVKWGGPGEDAPLV